MILLPQEKRKRQERNNKNVQTLSSIFLDMVVQTFVIIIWFSPILTFLFSPLDSWIS